MIGSAVPPAAPGRPSQLPGTIRHLCSKYAFHKTSGMHSNDTHVRITVEFPAWDASAGGNARINLKNSQHHEE